MNKIALPHFLLISTAALCPATASAATPKEVALGRHLSADLERKSSVVTAPEIADYIRALGFRLRSSGVSLKVIADEHPRAVAFPGGFVYISTGLIARAESEAELAGVLAHAIAHTELPPDHPAAGGTMPIYNGTEAGGLCVLWVQSHVPRGTVPALRSRESAANARGAEIAQIAGFDPLGLVEFLTKFRYDFPNSAEYLPIDDLLALRTRIEGSQPPSAQYVVDSNAFLAVRQSAELDIRARNANAPDTPTLRKRTP